MKHHCHAAGCKKACPPRWLMCRECWALVPADLQREVYRTVKLRGKHVDETWAPWWRAQAHAIAHVAKEQHPDKTEAIDRVLKNELAFAELLEKRGSRSALFEVT